MNKVYGKFDFKSIKDYDVNLLYKIMEQGKHKQLRFQQLMVN